MNNMLIGLLIKVVHSYYNDISYIMIMNIVYESLSDTIDVKAIIIGQVLINKYDQLLSFLRYNVYLRVNCTVHFKLFT